MGAGVLPVALYKKLYFLLEKMNIMTKDGLILVEVGKIMNLILKLQ